VRTLFRVEIYAQNVFRHRSRTLIKLLVKLGTALLTGPAENCPISSPVRLLIQKLFWASGERFKIASLPEHDISIPFKFGVIKWPLFLFKHLRTVLVEALLRDTCNARRTPCANTHSPFLPARASTALHVVLGVTRDSTLTFDDLVNNVVRSCNYHLRALRHLRPLMLPNLRQPA